MLTQLVLLQVTQTFSSCSTAVFRLLEGYRESAFYNALLAAGIMTQISRACAQGNLRTCGCRPEVDWRDGKWAWPDDEKCKSNHVEYANTFTRRFVNKRFTVRAKDLPHMVYVHNSRVGRRVSKF
jgi:wnt family